MISRRKQVDIDIINFVRRFQNFIGGILNILSKYNVELKTLLLQGLSEPELYGDLVYMFRKVIGKNDFPYHFKKIILRDNKSSAERGIIRPLGFLV